MTLPEPMLRSILENPHDDGPRLVAADYLEEHGACDRAEFIRVQCEFANTKKEPCCDKNGNTIEGDGDRMKVIPCPFCEWSILRRRADELLAANWQQWLPQSDTHAFRIETPIKVLTKRRLPEIKVEFHRGFISQVECRLADFAGDPCPERYGDGWHKSPDYVSQKWACETCHGTGRTPGLGALLLRRCPIERVVTDRKPYYNNEGHSWWDAPFSPINAQHPLSDIPNEIWKKICGFRRVSELAKYFDSADAANAALSAALIKLAREQMEPKEVTNV